MTPITITRRIHLEQTDSTNSEARRLIDRGELLSGLTLIDADAQLNGRGQRGNSWESEPGKNLSFSLVCHPMFLKANEQFLLSQAIALAVAECVDAEVKWPNDIYAGNRKLGGILIECDLKGCEIETCIIGTGINVNQTIFVSDAPNPVSLKQLTGQDYNREELLKKITERFLTHYDSLSRGLYDNIRNSYAQRLYRRLGYHAYADVNGEFEASIAGIQPSGHLLLQLSDGEVRRYEFKEVRFIL